VIDRWTHEGQRGRGKSCRGLGHHNQSRRAPPEAPDQIGAVTT
jgi:hypothetical protein